MRQRERLAVAGPFVLALAALTLGVGGVVAVRHSLVAAVSGFKAPPEVASRVAMVILAMTVSSLVAGIGITVIGVLTRFGILSWLCLLFTGACWVGSVLVCSPAYAKTLDPAFLDAFAKWLNSERALAGVDDLVRQIEEKAKQNADDGGARQMLRTVLLTQDDLPPCLRGMYPKSRVHGRAMVSPSGKVLNIVLLWGGPSGRWGIEAELGPKTWVDHLGASMTRQIRTNITCFITND